MIGLGSRFDWYEATFDDVDDGRVPLALAVALGASTSRGKGRNGYGECTVVERDGEALAHVYGRSARAGEVHITATSDACDEVVPLVRAMWPEHRVSRADSAVDFLADFAELDTRAVAFAEARGIKFSLLSDSDGGSTRRLGSPSSEVFARVYKKSEQLRALHPERAASVPDGVVRAECVARPGKRDVKEAVAAMTSDEVWGLSGWSRDFAGAFLDVEAPRTSTHFRRPSDWARTMHYFGLQYAPVIARRLAERDADEVRAEVLEALGL